jgi:chromosome segregation ATPase
MKKILLAVAILTGLLSFSVAQAYVPLLPEINKKIGSEILTQARCDKITKAMENRIENFEKRQNLHVPAYDNLKSRLDTLISKLESRGYDVSDLKAEVSTLEEKINKLDSDYNAFIAKLNEIKDYACDHTNAEVKVKLVEARALLKTVREDNLGIRNYFKTVIRPDIVQIGK